MNKKLENIRRRTHGFKPLILAVSFILLSNQVTIDARAQSSTTTIPQEETLAARKQSSEQELNQIQNQIELSAAKKLELKQEIEKLDKDRTGLNRSLIEISARSRSLEEGIQRTSDRLSNLRGQEEIARQSMLAKRSILIEVIAALQRMGHRPPPAILVTPEDALASVRSAILMGAVVPQIRQQTQILVSQLKDLVAIRQEIEVSRAALSLDLEKLAEDEERLTLLLEEKREIANKTSQELSKQTALAAELAGKAKNLSSLIAQLGNNIDLVRKAQKLAKDAEDRRLALEKANPPKPNNSNIKQPNFGDSNRIAPSIAFAKTKGLLPKPVVGVEVASFGKKNFEGEISQGISIATRNNARVQAPADGWVIYAGPFRSYGKLLILDAGGGYHIVMSGMEQLNVELGQFVLTGEPVALMSTSEVASTVNLELGSKKPILYIEFRKDGKSVDPSPWWTANILKERNG